MAARGGSRQSFFRSDSGPIIRIPGKIDPWRQIATIGLLLRERSMLAFLQRQSAGHRLGLCQGILVSRRYRSLAGGGATACQCFAFVYDKFQRRRRGPITLFCGWLFRSGPPRFANQKIGHVQHGSGIAGYNVFSLHSQGGDAFQPICLRNSIRAASIQ